MMSKKDDNEIIVQSNSLVQAHYRLSLQEKRLVLWLSKQIRKDDVDFRKYILNIKEFAKEVGLNETTQYRELKQITASLISVAFFSSLETKARNMYLGISSRVKAVSSSIKREIHDCRI